MADVLTTLSNDMASLVETVGQSVVRVEARRRLPATGVVWSDDGLIVTAHHIVQRDDGIKVGLPDGEAVTASLIGRDPSTDLAVLRADPNGLTAPTWAEAETLRVGHLVLALGRPGRTVQATLGVISALGESWRTPVGGRMDHYLQSDVVMYPGFSGGPLIGMNGAVMGINSSALLRGVSLAVPTLTVNRVAETLVAHGRVRRGYLGIGAQPARLPEALAEELGQETGLLLVSVEKGSPAEQAGLVIGDTIVSFAGQSIRHLDDLLILLSGDTVGQEVTAQIIRGGQFEEVGVVIGERSQ
jgi:S1-C subfamily serine protease